MTTAESAKRNFAQTTVALDCNPMHIKTKLPALTSEAIYPGMLVAFTTANTIKNTAAAATDDAVPVLALAMEKGEVGETVHDVYDDLENVIVLYPKKGDRVLARIKNGEDIVAGDQLVGEGDGTFREAASAELPTAMLEADGTCDMGQSDEDEEIALCPCVVL